MSYSSRIHRQRNPKTQEDGKDKPFFSARTREQKGNPGPGFFQPKLSVHQTDDHYEREADSVAGAVINKSSRKPEVMQNKISSIQRLSTPVEDEKLGTNDARMQKDKEIQEKTIEPADKEKEKMTGVQKKDEPFHSSSSVDSAIGRSTGKGNPLAAKTKREMGSSFGVDFSEVNIHTDQESAEMNKELHAQAFTHGNDIYFNTGKYNPETADGKFLLAHELTHVIQQKGFHAKGSSVQRTIGDVRDLSSPRFKGDPDLEACFDDEIVIRKNNHNRGEFVRKVQQALIDAGIPLPRFGADAVFGDETGSAVKEFQKQSGLDVSEQDGEIGSVTMSRLDSRFTGSSATSVEKTCDSGIKTLTIDFVKMRGSTGNPVADIAFANQVFKDCCIQFVMGTQVTLPDALSDSLLGGDTDLNMAGCNAVSSEDLITFLTATSTFGLTSPVVAFYVDLLHDEGSRARGVSVSPLCATGPRAPMQGMISIANGADARTFPHELAHVLMNTFADHRVTADNLQHISNGATGEKIASQQCAIMYTRV